MIDGMYSVSVYVSDPAKAVAWYSDALGMEVLADIPFGDGLRWIEVAAVGSRLRILLNHRTGDWKPERVGQSTGIVLTADDVPQTCSDLQDRGVVFPMPPQQFEWGWSAVFADPDGNTFGLRQSGT